MIFVSQVVVDQREPTLISIVEDPRPAIVVSTYSLNGYLTILKHTARQLIDRQKLGQYANHKAPRFSQNFLCTQRSGNPSIIDSVVIWYLSAFR
jgi:hypothetical protein